MDNTGHDVAVVGGGINGCVAAMFLAEDHDVVVLEKGQLASGTTARASGLITVIPDYISREAAPFSMAEFSLSRFDDRSTDFGSTYIQEPGERV